MGRWLSADPAGPVDGLNLYVYVSDNPVRKVDPEGMAENEPTTEMYPVEDWSTSTEMPEESESEASTPKPNGKKASTQQVQSQEENLYDKSLGTAKAKLSLAASTGGMTLTGLSLTEAERGAIYLEATQPEIRRPTRGPSIQAMSRAEAAEAIKQPEPRGDSQQKEIDTYLAIGETLRGGAFSNIVYLAASTKTSNPEVLLAAARAGAIIDAGIMLGRFGAANPQVPRVPNLSLPSSTGTGKVQSLTERAAELQQRLPSGNRASIPHPGGRLNVDLAGKPHHVKGVGDIPTPHVQEFRNNIIPSGPRAGQVGSRSQVGPTRPATARDLRTVDRWLKSEGL